MNRVVLAAAIFVTHCCVAQVITTVAGGAGVFRGDGSLAVRATLGEMRGVAVDAAGNVYAADLDHSIVVKITPAGVITVVAGNGIRGFSGDGGPATSAALNYPHGLVVDSAGNLYIADLENYRVRKVSPNGIITTVAGKDGPPNFLGDGGPATSASLSSPSGIAMDRAGSLYLTDNCNHRVRKVDTTGTITTVAGSGPTGCAEGGFSGDGGPATSARFNRPNGLAFDSAGNLYVGDTGNHRVRKISVDGTITTVAGNGTEGLSAEGALATNTSLSLPWWIALDTAGNLYIGGGFQRVQRVTPTGIISTFAGNGQPGFSGDGGPATSASLVNNGFQPGVAVDTAGNLFIADTGNYRVRRVNTGGIISTIAGTGPQGFGDGGPGTSAALGRPNGLAIDRAGNLYIADTRNNRVRRVTPSGLIATFAGTGTAGVFGDGGFATSAELNQPQAVAFDSSGNLYIADMLNNRIRRVTPDGIISTAAGGGSGGDGGQAADAALSGPQDVAFDVLGSLYIAETFGNRIRKVDRNGIISTVAGNGLYAFSGDGGAATSASLAGPEAIVVDRAGNLYIGDRANFRVRRVSPAGIITTIAGIGRLSGVGDGGPAISAGLSHLGGLALDGLDNLYLAEHSGVRKIDSAGIISRVTGNYGFSGDGGLARDASVSSPKGLAFDAVGNLYIADTENDRVRKVLNAAPTMSLTPSTLNLSATAGSPASTPQQASVSSSIPGLQWSLRTNTSSGGDWLSVSPAAGSTPGTFGVIVDATSLTPGTYQGSITVTAPLALPPAQTIPVTLTVTPALPAQLFVNSSSLTFQVLQGSGNPAAQILRVGNAGSGTLSWAAQASTLNGGNWLAVGPASGSASAAFPAVAQVAVNVSGLVPGVYSGSVAINAAALQQTQSVGITLLITRVTQTILLSQSGLTFVGVENSPSAPPQSFGILNTGQGTMNWTVEASTLAGGSWLSVSPTSGSTTANTLDIPIVDVRVSPRGLRSGQYTGMVRVSAEGADNSPQFVVVELTVLPAGSNPGVQVRPTGLIFAAQAGGSSPSSQTVRVATGAAGNVEARTGLQTFDGASWIDVQPRNGVLSAIDSRVLTVQPSLGTLSPGVYRGAMTFLFSDDTPLQTVNVLFLVVSAAQGADGPGAAASCVPQRLHAVHRNLGSNFVAPVARATALEVQVADDCGNAVSNASVVASFSNGDRSLPLASLGKGVYSGTWRPVNAASLAMVRVRADRQPLTAVEITTQGTVSANTSAPALFSGGVVNAASFAPGSALAPGEIVSVFGRNLAASGGATTLPLPTTLGGATVSIGGIDVPLFYSGDGQLNAQIPFGLTAATRPQVVVKRGNDVAGPETITVATVAPGIFTINQQGTGQGAILDTQNRLVDASSPAAAGEVVAVYATGLGLTNPVGVTGQAAGPTLSRVTTPVTATVGGLPATVQFAGLAPGFAGLYQVNVQIPAGITPGSASLVLSQNGVPSNGVTMAAR